jgi:hypothetical protein
MGCRDDSSVFQAVCKTFLKKIHNRTDDTKEIF